MNVNKNKGDYIVYKSKYPGDKTTMSSSGTIHNIVVKNGQTQYIVAEGNGGANLVYVDPKDVLNLLTE